MSAAETDDLDIFQVGMLRRVNRGAQHPGMIVVDYIQAALREIDLIQTGNRIRCEDIDSLICKHLWNIVVDQVVVLVRPCRQNDCSGLLCRCFPDTVEDLLSLGKKLIAIAVLGCLSLMDCPADKLHRNPEGLFHKFRQLALPVDIGIPEKNRHIVFDIPAFFRIIGVFDDQGEALDDAAHGHTGTLCVL